MGMSSRLLRDATSLCKALLILGLGMVLMAAILGAILFLFMFGLPGNPHDDVRAFTRHIAEFQATADSVLAKKLAPRYQDRDYAPPAGLAALGINAVWDNKDGTVVFSYGLEVFDGPTRVLIYDPGDVEKGDHHAHITRPDPQWVQTIGPWTYIKNRD